MGTGEGEGEAWGLRMWWEGRMGVGWRVWYRGSGYRLAGGRETLGGWMPHARESGLGSVGRRIRGLWLTS